MKGYRKFKGLRQFYADQQGALAITFVLLGSFLLSMGALGIEGSRYISEKARLSDALEQAALVLTAENNGENSRRNQVLAKSYIQAYMRNEAAVYTPVVTVSKGVETTSNGTQSYIEYRVSNHTLHNSWFSSPYFPGFKKQVAIGGNGAARKSNGSDEADVVIIYDRSKISSVRWYGGERGYYLINRAAKRLFNDVVNRHPDNKVSVIPVGYGVPYTQWGGVVTHDQYGRNVYQSYGTFCYFPYVLPFEMSWQYWRKDPNAPWIGEHFAPKRKLQMSIDYAATVAAIPNHIERTWYINVGTENNCLMGRVNKNGERTTPLARDSFFYRLNFFERDDNLIGTGGEKLLSSGILVGAETIAKSTARRRVMVIISSIEEYGPPTYELIMAGMCKKIIDSALTTKYFEGKIIFLGFDPGTGDHVGWENNCVGKGNFIDIRDTKKLDEVLWGAGTGSSSSKEEVGHNTLKR